MEGYKVFFDDGSQIYKLPVNPEEIEVTSSMAVEKYVILKSGQIAVPSNVELKEYSFECEFPIEREGVIPSYVSAPNEFHNPKYFLMLFDKWMKELTPVMFIAGRYINSNTELEIDSISTQVLIQELSIIEKAGEEGDKYVSFKLLEYRDYGKKSATVEKITTFASGSKAKKKKVTITKTVNPKSNGYHVVVSGDSLWSIAKKYYGDGSKCNIIFNANKDKIKNPSVLNVGWKLKIPATDELSKYSAALSTSKTTTSKTNSTPSSYEQGIAGIASVLNGGA